MLLLLKGNNWAQRVNWEDRLLLSSSGPWHWGHMRRYQNVPWWDWGGRQRWQGWRSSRAPVVPLAMFSLVPITFRGVSYSNYFLYQTSKFAVIKGSVGNICEMTKVESRGRGGRIDIPHNPNTTPLDAWHTSLNDKCFQILSKSCVFNKFYSKCNISNNSKAL